MQIKEYLKSHTLITDGAMGTYFDSIKTDSKQRVEEANVTNPDIIKSIHLEYIKSGAKLIRTNTFDTNLGHFDSEEKVKENITCAIEIAKQAVKESKEEVFIGASIGPIRLENDMSQADVLKEYQFICDTFLSLGVDIFVFETFAELDIIRKITAYVKEKNNAAFILTQFTVNKTGYTPKGISVARLVRECSSDEHIDAYGLNCGIGAAHLYQLLKKIEFPNDKFVSALPNASYPTLGRGEFIYSDNTEYYINKLKKIAGLGIDIIGGCCGTSPSYIKMLTDKVGEEKREKKNVASSKEEKETRIQYVQNEFIQKLERKEKVFVVELDPPFGAQVDKVMEGAYELVKANVDMITLSDSPLARPRADSVQIATKISNELDIPVMPHITCRDKNIIGLHSTILGAHINDLRNLLIITGDPVPRSDQEMISNVYDFNSIRFMKYIKEMNQEYFGHDPMYYGGALNHNLPNLDKVVERMKKKQKQGASYFLTQPIYSKEDVERIAYIKTKIDAPILCGIMPLVSYRNALFMQNEMPGIKVPDEVVALYHKDMERKEAEEVAINLSLKIAKELEPVCDGYYFMVPFQRVNLITTIMNEMRK